MLLVQGARSTLTLAPMSSVLTGNKNNLPGGLDPTAWANEVWTTVEERNVSLKEAKAIVASRYATKAEEKPRWDKMIKSSRNKGF